MKRTASTNARSHHLSNRAPTGSTSVTVHGLNDSTAKERQGPQGPPSPPKRRADGGGSGASDAEKQKLEQERRRSPFVNLQWALGTAGSGAPVHFHNTAWNQLFYGE